MRPTTNGSFPGLFVGGFLSPDLLFFFMAFSINSLDYYSMCFAAIKAWFIASKGEDSSIHHHIHFQD